jgi:hypothetical protein
MPFHGAMFGIAAYALKSPMNCVVTSTSVASFVTCGGTNVLLDSTVTRVPPELSVVSRSGVSFCRLELSIMWHPVRWREQTMPGVAKPIAVLGRTGGAERDR